MTERWRKKLGDLDATGPDDDVLARAHEGPTQPDPQIDLPSTRIEGQSSGDPTGTVPEQRC